ncbi:MAG: sugar phosphate isomerase/epimerase family protein [Bryobacteraceae bacterium]
MNRRELLALCASWPAVGLGSARLPIKKALYIGMLPRDLSYAERFKLARDAGFEEIECQTTPDRATAEEIRSAAASAGIRIHSVMNQAHWKFPLSSADPAVVAESLRGMETSLENASFWGADTVLLVPAVVNPETSYVDAYRRSRENILKLLPLAQKLKVIIAIENVWNRFLLSPLEFAGYIDSFRSPWVQAYFDVGNIALYGYPQDWIRILDKRIVKIHLKDFCFRKNVAAFVPLREGDLDWPAIYKALAEVGFRDTATCELPAGDEAYLREVSRRVDLILSGE